MGRFEIGLADLPSDLKIGGVANRFANHFCDFLFANGQFVRTNSTFLCKSANIFFSDHRNNLTLNIILQTHSLTISPNTMNSSNLRRKHCLKTSIVQVLATHRIDKQEVSSIVQEINDCVQTAWQIYGGKLSSIKAPMSSLYRRSQLYCQKFTHFNSQY